MNAPSNNKEAGREPGLEIVANAEAALADLGITIPNRQLPAGAPIWAVAGCHRCGPLGTPGIDSEGQPCHLCNYVSNALWGPTGPCWRQSFAKDMLSACKNEQIRTTGESVECDFGAVQRAVGSTVRDAALQGFAATLRRHADTANWKLSDFRDAIGGAAAIGVHADAFPGRTQPQLAFLDAASEASSKLIAAPPPCEALDSAIKKVAEDVARIWPSWGAAAFMRRWLWFCIERYDDLTAGFYDVHCRICETREVRLWPRY